MDDSDLVVQKKGGRKWQLPRCQAVYGPVAANCRSLLSGSFFFFHDEEGNVLG